MTAVVLLQPLYLIAWMLGAIGLAILGLRSSMAWWVALAAVGGSLLTIANNLSHLGS